MKCSKKTFKVCQLKNVETVYIFGERMWSFLVGLRYKSCIYFTLDYMRDNYCERLCSKRLKYCFWVYHFTSSYSKRKKFSLASFQLKLNLIEVLLRLFSRMNCHFKLKWKAKIWNYVLCHQSHLSSRSADILFNTLCKL